MHGKHGQVKERVLFLWDNKTFPSLKGDSHPEAQIARRPDQSKSSRKKELCTAYFPKDSL